MRWERIWLFVSLLVMGLLVYLVLLLRTRLEDQVEMNLALRAEVGTQHERIKDLERQLKKQHGGQEK